MGRTNKVKSWQDFKALALEKKPKSIVYIIARSIPTRNLTSLKLILPVEDTQHIFTDTAKDDKLRRIGIPIQIDKKGNPYFPDEDVKNSSRHNSQSINCKSSRTGQPSRKLALIKKCT